jgi:hypothetical protein
MQSPSILKVFVALVFLSVPAFAQGDKSLAVGSYHMLTVFNDTEGASSGFPSHAVVRVEINKDGVKEIIIPELDDTTPERRAAVTEVPRQIVFSTTETIGKSSPSIYVSVYSGLIENNEVRGQGFRISGGKTVASWRFVLKKSEVVGH